MKTQDADGQQQSKSGQAMSLLNELKYLRAADVRGIAQLATQATLGVSHIAEGVHRAVWNTMGMPGGAAPGQTRGITGLVYKSVRAVTQLAGSGTDAALAGLQSLLQARENSLPDSPRREAVLAALNGVMGDRLAASNNGLAITMTMRYQGQALNWQDLPVLPQASGKVLLLIHGLCMNDLQLHAEQRGHAIEHGEALASTLAYTPVYLRYNSGLHTSHNGRELSHQLEQLLAHWSTPVEELSVVAHSMGGLLIRSAFHYAKQESMRWPAQLKNIVFLGTPHHGAALERAGNWLDEVLAGTPYTRPFTRLGRLRSAGITDLRHGNVLDEHWQGSDRFKRETDKRQPVPLPGSVACYTVAATMASKRSALSDRLMGDGLVPVHSALGQHRDADRTLMFAESSQWLAYRMGHMDLLSKPEVSQQIVQWLTPLKKIGLSAR